ncbi:dol-P-Man:Man(7)GlcNAc(2)-PP-Dol alpha-1,6-mannosyltransferase [Planoprotostelium fungivorum]|uniref:Mannosyltransferase n=1 Tax=Planoprotostelium fungivorum TaxID=1890364 RepID=A0A2P6NAG9_9EUKA|nr:dol-P-Man:Man(7)GlcNAc(2)-PP-Dol alpha-1,6-mannosyltransferase [Planoprotostelium fungivorum]
MPKARNKSKDSPSVETDQGEHVRTNPEPLDRWDMYVFFTAIFYMVLCPYTKVEESFNMQAMHDILYHGRDIDKYDHLEFPGVVPRSFIGPLIVTAISYPLHFMLQTYMSLLSFEFDFSPKLISQLIVRAILAALVLSGYFRLRRAAAALYGKNTALWFSIITCLTQFHLLFYVSRPLPNTFALALVLHAYAAWLSGKHERMIACFVFAIVVFRSEVVGILGPLTLILWITREISVTFTLYKGIVYGLISLALTVIIDSIFWKRFLWPEGEVLWYNTYQNESHKWGTSPFHWYFSNALPRSLLAALPLSLYAICTDFRKVWKVLTPSVVFLSLYSFLPHKELRFVFYVIPIFNLTAAVGLHRLQIQRKKSLVGRLLFSLSILALLVSAAATLFFFSASVFNYPGGVALQRLHHLGRNSPEKERYVHIDVATAVSGASRFGEMQKGWRYSKLENLKEEDMTLFHYILSENSTVKGFETIGSAHGFDGVERDWTKLPWIIRTRETIYIQKRNKT